MTCKNKNSIVFVNQSSGYLMIDIINAFRERYSERILIAGFLNPRNKPLDDDVKIEKIVRYRRTNGITRLLTWITGFFQAFFLCILKYPKSDLFLTSNPPFTPVISLFTGNSTKILIYDIYPDVLVQSGVLKKSSILVKFWEYVNRIVFKKADTIYTITEELKTQLQKYTEPDKIKVVPIWTDNQFMKPIPKDKNPFAQKYDLENKFVVMYSGNLGRTHPVELVPELAEKCKDPNVFFLIIGEGEKYLLLNDLIKKKNLRNIKLLPWQPTKNLPFTMAAADLALVTLEDKAGQLSLPSKTLNFLSAGVPILGICREDASIAKLIDKYQVGAHFRQDNTNKILEFIQSLARDSNLRQQLCMNAINASNSFTPENAVLFL